MSNITNENVSTEKDIATPPVAAKPSKKAFAVYVRSVFGISKSVCSTLENPIYSNQLYSFTMKTGEVICGFVNKVSEVRKSMYPNDIIDYSIGFSSVFDDVTSRFVPAGSSTILASDVAKMMRKHPTFIHVNSDTVDRTKVKEYSVYALSTGDDRMNVATYELIKFTRSGGKSEVNGYIEGTTKSPIDGTIKIRVKAIAFYHGLYQESTLIINMNDVTGFSREKIMIEDFKDYSKVTKVTKATTPTEDAEATAESTEE